MRPRPPLRHDQGLVGEVGHRDAAAPRERVAVRHRHHRRLVQEEQELQPLAGRLRWPDQRQVEPPGQQARQQPQRLVLQDLHNDLGRDLAKVVQEAGDEADRRAVHHADAQQRGPVARLSPDPLHERVGLGQQRPRFVEEEQAVLAQRHAPGGPRHEAGAQILFEQMDVPAEGRRQHV